MTRPSSSPQVAELVIDQLEPIARLSAKPTGDMTTPTVATTAPERRFRYHWHRKRRHSNR